MIEKDMEDLIAAYPDDFFPDRHFALIARQRSFAGIGRFDLVFEDSFKSTILIELKARTLKYEDATQIARYRDELKRNGTKNIVMWLVATHIPSSVREFLDDKGIEYSEFHISEFRRVAERRNFSIKSEVEPGDNSALNTTTKNGGSLLASKLPRRTQPPSPVVPTGPIVTARTPFCWRAAGYDLVLDNPERFDHTKFLRLVDNFAAAVRSGKNKSLVNDLKAWAENPRYGRLASTTIETLLRWTTNRTNWKAAAPDAYEVWLYLFGSPAPTWKEWNDSEQRYEFDGSGWRLWFASLSGTET
jgi:hypothetical protein